MPSKIRVLSEQTINQIAAGEVIENPASVVKELVENSLDAGATEICVEITGGGRQLIRITDNGCGMNSDDALLCLERHATSKIKEVEEIHAITTMGFRGEAIPSIASISKFTLLTCPHEEGSEGTMVIVEGGRILKHVPAARSPGTTIEVKSLFFNVPVRKKFQKSPAYDANEILKIISVIALGNPHVKFQLINNHENALQANLANKGSFQEQLETRIGDILGTEFKSALCPIEWEQGDYHLKGFIGKPSYTRNNRTGQYLFINQRPVVSPLISYAVREGFGTTLSTTRHPVFVLHLTMPGTLVDVNVHPQKREVRLREEQNLKEAIVRSVEAALQQSKSDFREETSIAIPSYASYFKEPSPAYPIKPAFTPQPYFQKPPQERSVPTIFPVQQEPPAAFFLDTPPKPTQKAAPKVIATIPRFILVEEQEGLRLVDQKAAHARVIFEKLSQAGNTLAVQTLLIPHTLETTPVEAALLRENLTTLNQLGIAIKEFGPNTFIIDALPQVFGNSDIESFINDLVHSLRDYHDADVFKKDKEKRIAMAASRTSVSNQKKLSLEEAQSLINQLMQCQSPHQCPLGKATMVHLTTEEITKLFTK